MAKNRPDLLDEKSPKGIEVVQLTNEDVPSSHVYMEAQIFSTDSKRFLLHRSAHAHGGDPNDAEHRYMVCDIEDDCRLAPITHETGATAPALSPDGKTVYYFVDETRPGGGKLTLKRVGIDGGGRETVLVVDAPLPGTTFRPSVIYPLSTISSDGKRLALPAFLGDGRTEGAPYGLMVFDLDAASVELILHGPTWCNLHPQYCRSTEPAATRDIMVQENHDNRSDANGKITALTGGLGADIHVICDDGTNFRNLPWGRDADESCQGHQCWRGRSTKAITSTVNREPDEKRLIESAPVAHAGHVGSATPGGTRNDLSRTFPAKPSFYHFGTDIDGKRLISDAAPYGYIEGTRGWEIYLADLPDGEGEPAGNWRYLLNPGSSISKTTHPHPFLSPDGRAAFFNSDESGRLQAYMILGLETVG